MTILATGDIMQPADRAALDIVASLRAACAVLGRPSIEHGHLARALWDIGERAEARAVLRAAAELDDADAATWETIGYVAYGIDAHDLARASYAAVVAQRPDDALARYNLASAERNLGRLTEAAAQCDAALATNPTLYQAALLRSQLRTQTATKNNVDWLRRALDRAGGNAAAEIFLNYALGKELEDLADYDAAFDSFGRGAAARRRTLRYDVASDIRMLARLREAYDARALAALPARQTPAFGFIIGLPRSGTTLTERLLTGHAGVASNGESDNFAHALLAATPPGPGDLPGRAAQADHTRISGRYRRLARTDATLTLEKLPLNYLYAGAIALALPDAALIRLRRDPLDNCLAMFTTLFGTAYPFSYDLDDLANYFEAYARLTRHWEQTLGDRLLTVDYERFVTEPEVVGPAIAAHCGIRWNAEAVRVERNNAASTTASAVQVRRPIYRSAVNRWRNYERQLAPLTDRLHRAALIVH